MVDVPPPDIGGRKAILELYAKKVGHLSSLLHSSYCIFPPSSYQSLTLLPYPSTVSLIISDLWYWNCASTYLQRILWRATYLPTYLPTYLTCYLPTLSSTYLPTYFEGTSGGRCGHGAAGPRHTGLHRRRAVQSGESSGRESIQRRPQGTPTNERMNKTN